MPLKDFLPKNPKNLILVTSADQVDDSKKNVKFIGQDWCGYSQLGIAQFNSVCEDLGEDEKCYLFDLSNEESKKAAEELDLLPQAYPNHVIIGKDGVKKEHLGMLKAPELREQLRELGFNV